MKKTLLPLLSLMVVLGACEKQPEYILNKDAFCGQRLSELTCKNKFEFCETFDELFVCDNEKGKPLSGRVVELNADGKKTAEFFVKNGLAHGDYKKFRKDGSLKMYYIYKKGLRNGRYETYQKDSKLNYKSFYKNGLEQGKAYSYNKNGKLVGLIWYDRGDTIKYIAYRENGTVEAEMNTQDDKIVQIKYDTKGNLTHIDYYDKEGHLLGEENYKNNKLDGERKEYSPNRNSDGKHILLSEQHWKNGKLNGVIKDYRETDGVISEEYSFKDGMRYGVSIIYNDDGSVSSETNYKNGVPHGISRSFYKNGKISHESNYNNGVPVGILKGYDEQGNLDWESVYEDGELVSSYEYKDGKRVKIDIK